MTSKVVERSSGKGMVFDLQDNEIAVVEYNLRITDDDLSGTITLIDSSTDLLNFFNDSDALILQLTDGRKIKFAPFGSSGTPPWTFRIRSTGGAVFIS